MTKLIDDIIALICTGIYATTACGIGMDDKLWWNRPKIAIAYGDVGGANEPIDGLKLMKLAGVTALVGGVSDSLAQRAKEEGINLIGLGYAWGIPHSIPSCRNAINEKGQISTAACPFSEPFWERTIYKPVMETARKSLKFSNIVGFFVDSEQYAVYPRMTLCFCDDCWERFLSYKNLQYPEINVSMRAKWLAEKDYLRGRHPQNHEKWMENPEAPFFGEYVSWVEDRLTEQYKRLADEVHKLNPKFVFGKLPEEPSYWYEVGMVRGTATDQAPFFVMTEGTYACAPSYGSKPARSGWEPGFDQLRKEMDNLGVNYRVIGGIWLTVDSKEKADPRYTRDVFQLYDQAHRLGSHPASDGYWFGPIQQIIIRDYFRQHHPGSEIRDYWLALRSINRLLGIQTPYNEQEALNYLRSIDD